MGCAEFVVLDSTELATDFHLRSGALLEVSMSAKVLGIQLAVPEVVFQEQLARYVHKYSVVHKALAELARFGTSKELDSLLFTPETYPAFLTTRLVELGIVRLPYPTLKHECVVARIQADKKPFSGGRSEKGYKDYLIWRSAVERAVIPSARVHLISDNTDDFAVPEKSQLPGPFNLHEDLLEELDSEDIARSRLVLWKRLRVFIEHEITHRLETLGTSAEAAEKEAVRQKIVELYDYAEQFVDDYSWEAMAGVSRGDAPCSSVQIAPEWTGPIDAKAVQITSITRVEGRLLVRAQAPPLDASLHIAVSRPVWEGFPETRRILLESNDSITVTSEQVLITMRVRIVVEASAVFDAATLKVHTYSFSWYSEEELRRQGSATAQVKA